MAPECAVHCPRAGGERCDGDGHVLGTSGHAAGRLARMLRRATKSEAAGRMARLLRGTSDDAGCGWAHVGGVSMRKLICTLVAVTVVVACGPAGPSPAPPPDATEQAGIAPSLVGQPTSAPAVPAPTLLASASQPQPGGRVTLGETTDAKTLNPILVADPTSEVVTSRIYAGLVSVDAKTGEVQPDLAEKFEVAQDGKSVVFQMRPGLKFSDGSPLTGDDFKFTVMAILRSK